MHGRGARRQRGMAAVSARDADTGPALSCLFGVLCTPTHPGVRTHILLEVGISFSSDSPECNYYSLISSVFVPCFV